MKDEFKLPLLLGLALSGSFASSVGFAANDHLQNSAQQQCLHAVNNTTSIYAQYCLANEPKQTWTYSNRRQLVNNGKCLSATSLNGSVNLSTCRITASMTWTYNATTQQYKNSKYNQCLDVSGGAINGRVLTWACHAGANQKWQFVAFNTPPADSWLKHDIKLNGIGIGIESANKVLLVPLGDGFDNPANYDATFNYGLADSGYTFAVNGTTINNGSSFRFTGIKYGASVPVQRKWNGAVIDTYTMVFTNLPVVQLSAANIVDEPKLPGKFRLMSGKFAQDTLEQNMGIEFRGQTAQAYPKKPYGIQIGTAADSTKALDVKLLDMRTDSDWILDATYRDQTFARNIVSHDIFRTLRPLAYAGATKGQSAIKGQLVEVIQNETYQGVYVLEEKPDRKLYDLKKITVPVDAAGVEQWSQVDFSNPDNGSVLYKADYGDSVFYDASTVTTNFAQDYPKSTDISRYQPLIDLTNFIANSTDQAFIADIGNRMDIDSIVDWWSLAILSNASDNMKKNFYLGKSGSSKFFMATWDHDATFGMDWQGGYDPGILDIGWSQYNVVENNLIRRLTTLPATGFNAKLKARWAALRANEYSQASLVARFDSYITQAAKGGATARNQGRWPGTGGAGTGDTRLGTTTFINDALATRLPQLDQWVNTLP